MYALTREKGRCGEDFAASILEKQGYTIMERNFWTKDGEIDIIARHDGVLHFIEVKTRTSSGFGHPEESVDAKKQMRLRRVGMNYLRQRHCNYLKVSFDVFTIEVNHIEDCL